MKSSLPRTLVARYNFIQRAVVLLTSDCIGALHCDRDRTSSLKYNHYEFGCVNMFGYSFVYICRQGPPSIQTYLPSWNVQNEKEHCSAMVVLCFCYVLPAIADRRLPIDVCLKLVMVVSPQRDGAIFAIRYAPWVAYYLSYKQDVLGSRKVKILEGLSFLFSTAMST